MHEYGIVRATRDEARGKQGELWNDRFARELLPEVTGLPGGWSQAPIEALECQPLESASKLIDGFAFGWQVLITYKRQSPVVPNQLICLQGKGTVRIRDT